MHPKFDLAEVRTMAVFLSACVFCLEIRIQIPCVVQKHGNIDIRNNFVCYIFFHCLTLKQYVGKCSSGHAIKCVCISTPVLYHIFTFTFLCGKQGWFAWTKIDDENTVCHIICLVIWIFLCLNTTTKILWNICDIKEKKIVIRQVRINSYKCV